MTQNETLTINLSKADKEIIANYAQSNGISAAQLVKEAALDRVEDDIDLESYRKAIKEYYDSPGAHGLD
ncbi:type II toxin-antitoxin system RelB family antitoxin [Salinicoccus carnicancri]|uniref:type II toxin-antitoxin system RelB family antitoxin n=1 Tax=Salinicoccus carnicancri TaxID=558170 RepID=UPI000318CA18|nr:DUF6290 family protein [Salinicoccus carnicancri]